MKYIVCGGSAGRAVLVGESETRPEPGKPFTLTNARMVLQWSAECGGLLGLAAAGPKTTTRITRAVPSLGDAVAHQVIACTPEASTAIDAWPSA